MKKQKNHRFCVGLGFLVAFVLWTVAIQWVDVQTIGPQGAAVGFAALNKFVHDLTGVHMLLYTVTDWLSLVPIGVMTGFGVLGFAQWVRRRSLWKVDRSILALGGLYLVVLAAYVFFERCVVNYRPIFIAGNLEASYPSSTTMLVLTVMPTATLQWNARVKNRTFRRVVMFASVVFAAFMVVGRFLSGVHWFTDIVGGVLISAGLVMLYWSLIV